MCADRFLECSYPVKTNSIIEDYEVEWREKLGCGVNGPVRPCRCRKTGHRYALKCLLDVPRSRREVQLQLHCNGHPHIVNISDIYINQIQFPSDRQPKSRLLVVMELMEGGELFERISKQRCFTEFQAARYTKQIALAIQRCHSLNIAHRDLKPENLLLCDNSEDAVIKLGDFGFAKYDDGNLMTPNFTPYYVSPQILEAQRRKAAIAAHQALTPYTYDKSCDLWSFGVIIYIMLCGYPPFYSETPSNELSSTMKRRIMAGQYEFPAEDWSRISPAAVDLVANLLKVDTEERLSIDEVLTHHWLREAPMSQLLSPAILSDKVAFTEVREAHNYQLMALRQNHARVELKPFDKTSNALLRKRNASAAAATARNGAADGTVADKSMKMDVDEHNPTPTKRH